METITIKAPGMNKTMEILSEPPIDCDLKIGDTVDFTNSYGLKFPGKKVLGFSNGYMMENYGNFIHIDTDAPWFPHRRDELTKAKA